MTYTDAIASARLNDLPESYAGLWDAFQALPQTKLWDDGYLIKKQALFGFCDELTAAVLRVKARIEADAALDALARFVHWAIFVQTKPFLAEKPCAVLPGALGDDKGLFGMVALINETPRTLETIENYGLDRKIIDNFKSLCNFANEYKKREGHWGMDAFSWNCSCVVPYMNRCGHLSFEPTSIEYPYNYYIHKQTGESLILMGEGVGCTGDGLMTSNNCPLPEAFKTVAAQGDGWIEGYRVNPLGFIERKTTRISPEDYDKVMKQWDVLLAFHIPSGPGYTVESTADSFDKAVKFFRKTFPDIDFKGIWCYSWLFSPLLQLILTPEESAMVQIQRHCYQVPGWRDSGAYNRFVFKVDGDLTKIELPQKSRLHRRLAAIVHRGGYLTSGGMLLPNALVDKWQDTVYDYGDGLDVFRATQPYDAGDLLGL